jgi:hypothetical protein
MAIHSWLMNPLNMMKKNCPLNLLAYIVAVHPSIPLVYIKTKPFVMIACRLYYMRKKGDSINIE